MIFLPKKIQRRIVSILVSLLVLCAGAGAAGYLWLRTSLPDLAGSEALPGLSADAEVIYDAAGIPHIRAATPADAYRALGYVHARDRLFQMDFMRRLGAGRLSEAVGSKTVGLDRTMRVLGLHRLAQSTYDGLPADARSYLDAYAEGVNAHLTANRGALPPEFVLLGYRPEAWKPADSLVWGRIMALRLSGNWRTEALRLALATRLNPGQIADLWPRDTDSVPPTLSFATAPPREYAGSFSRLLDAVPAEIGQISASNAWVLAGSRTETGKPLLANDPHLGFQAPVLWYLARMSAPGLDLTGATVPGVPFHLLGHNGRIAWGFTTTDSDTQDLFIERLSAGRPGYYDTPDGPAAFAERTERISVKDAAAVEITVRETRHGPVISDLDAKPADGLAKDHVIALAATALAPDDRTALALLQINRARNWDEFRSAMVHFHAPQQNISYADTDGNIGFFAPGRVPVRRSGDGAVPAEGWTGARDWTGFIPFEALPRAFNPAAGSLVNANHRIVPHSYPWHLTHDWAAPYRAARIYEALAARPRHNPATMAALQNDTISGAARAVLPVLLDLVRPADDRMRWAVGLLSRWSGEMDRNSAAPLVFSAWLAEANRLLYRDELGPHFPRYFDQHPVAVLRMLTERPRWCDDITTPGQETCAEIVTAALGYGLADLARRFGGDIAAWRWGAAHYAHFRHPVLGRVPVLRNMADIRIESSGGAYTVNRAQYRVSAPYGPFASVHGPGFRAIYDLADLPASRFAIATGQSGNPLSDRYADRIADWRDGKYVRIPQTRDDALRGARGILRLMRAP